MLIQTRQVPGNRRAPSGALTCCSPGRILGPGRPDPDNRGAVQHILALSRSAVIIRHWFEINLDDASMEHGARIEIRELVQHPHRGSESASQLTTVDRPLWRADLFDRLADAPGSFSAAHYHPNFTGNEPSARFWDAALSSDPGPGWRRGGDGAAVRTGRMPLGGGVLPDDQGRPGRRPAHDHYLACTGASGPGPGDTLAGALLTHGPWTPEAWWGRR